MPRQTASRTLSLTVSPPAAGRTLYVSPSGNDANSGLSDALAWKTLQKAANTVVAGDTVVVRAGTYRGFNAYGKSSGTASAPIAFAADSGVTINSLPNSGLPNDTLADINVENSGNYWTISGFTISGAGTQRGCIRVTGCNGAQVLNNTVSGGFIGVFVSNCDGALIQNNSCSNSTDQHGIYCSGSRNCTIRGNTCFGNNYDGIHVNVLTGQLGDGGSGGVTNHLVEGNTCHDNTLAGMDIEGVSGCMFRNNRIWGNGKHGFTIHSQDQANTPRTANCTFVNNTVLNTNTNITACIQFQSVDTAGMVVFDNSLINMGNGGTMWTFAAPMAGFVCDYNAVSDVYSQNGGTTKITLAQWRTATGQDAHSFVATAAALFVNPATNDYRLKAGSPALNAGVASLAGKAAPPTDFAGVARPVGAAWDLGCYESG